MLKKIIFLCFTALILMFSNNLFAEINSVVPLKKPILSKEEIKKKISINILKPLKKPSKIKEVKIEKASRAVPVEVFAAAINAFEADNKSS